MKETLLKKTMKHLSLTLAAVMLLCAPVFYFLTTRFYAEDLIDVVEDYRMTGKIEDDLDLEQDVIEGMMLQYILIASVISVTVFFTTRRLTKRLWKTFDDTLGKIEHFKLGKDKIPEFAHTDIREFARLNETLAKLLHRNIDSYKIQKEFTENASHELQTPIAIIRADLDMLLQEDLNARELKIVDNMYDVTRRLEQLNHSLLLLAKIENSQYEEKEHIVLHDFIQMLLPEYAKIYTNSITLTSCNGLDISANKALLETLVNNLAINALRNTTAGIPVEMSINRKTLSISNMSETGGLDRKTLFSRFNNRTCNKSGNGLGLAIVKQICDYYGWDITYTYDKGRHTFTVAFGQDTNKKALTCDKGKGFRL